MTTESIVTTFRDVDHWLEFTRSHGGLIAWDAVPEDAVPDVEAELHRRLMPLRSSDSSLELVTGVRFCTAHAPAG